MEKERKYNKNKKAIFMLTLIIEFQQKQDSYKNTQQYISQATVKYKMSALADCCFPCCKCIAFFGILFYFIMAFIILGQVQFLKFIPVDQTSSVVACIITCIIEAVILILLIVWEKYRNKSTVERENYLSFQNEKRPRESTFKGIAMSDIKGMKQPAQIEKPQHQLI